MSLRQSLCTIRLTFQGRRASLRSALCPWLLHSAPLALKEKQFRNFNSLHFQIESAVFQIKRLLFDLPFFPNSV